MMVGIREFFGCLGNRLILIDRVTHNIHQCFYYTTTGAAPAAVFWADAQQTPTASGLKLFDGAPSDTCGSVVLGASDGTQNYRVEFPLGYSIFDYLNGSIGVWCEAVVRFSSAF